jgi:hypothetical protein
MWGSTPGLRHRSGCSCSPGPRGLLRGQGLVRGVGRPAWDGRGRTIFGRRRSLPNFERAARGRRRGLGASVALWGRPVTLIDPGTNARLGGRRRIFDPSASWRSSRRGGLESAVYPARRDRQPGPAARPNRRRLDNHRRPSGAVVPRTKRRRTDTGPAETDAFVVLRPQAQKNKRMRIPRPGPPAQRRPGRPLNHPPHQPRAPTAQPQTGRRSPAARMDPAGWGDLCLHLDA